MDYFLALISGFFSAFLGLLAPSMLNMTISKITIERGKSAGFRFAFGATIILSIHCSVAVYFAKYLVANPSIIAKLKFAAIFVFLVLAIFFYFQAKKENKTSNNVGLREGKPFFMGMGMALLNMLGVPFYLAMVTFAESEGFVQLKIPYSGLYVFGAFWGDFSLFAVYITFALKIAERASFIAKNMNYILSFIFIFLTILTTFQALN